MLSNDKLIAELEGGALLVTANQRLSRTLAAEYSAVMKQRGWRAWATPEILHWTAWLKGLWLAGHGGGDVLLGDSQCQTLWDDIVKPDIEYDAGGRLGRSARESWIRQVEWQITSDEVRRFGNREARTYCRWVQAYEETLAARHWIDPAQLAARVDPSALPVRRVLLIGFYQLNPLQSDLINRLAAAGWDIATVERESAAGERRLYRAANPDQELLAAAAWAKERLAADPTKRLAVIVPDLRERQDVAERYFARTLDPGSLLSFANDSEPMFHLSVGRPLDEQALVHDALLALTLIVRGLNSHQLSRYLRSPYFSFSSDATEYAQLDARLRSQWFDSISVANLHWICSREPTLTSMRVALEAVQKNPFGRERRPASEWSTLFATCLSTMGWPGARSMDSVERQAMDRWSKLLFEIGRLDLLDRSLTAAQALGYLERLANTTEFQPERPDAPVQILGMLEATGSRFDAVWITGLDDHTLPAAPRPVPFIPTALQIEHGLVHASTDNEIRFARQQLTELCATAANVMISWPDAVNNEARRRSPLIDSDDCEIESPLPAHEWASSMAGAAVEWPPDDKGINLASDRLAAGGTQIFQYQSQCPFKAYAALRLHAGSLDDPSPGMSPRLRGVLAHEAMESVWERLGNQSGLLELDDAEHESLIDDACEKAWAAHRFETQFVASGINELERRRLRTRIRRSLEADKQRADFEIARLERLEEASIGGVPLRIKIDRVDRLADGRELIIDYKTGSVKPNDALGPRPDNPQLAVYAVSNDAETAGVLYGLLGSDQKDYVGFVAEDGLLGSLKGFGGSRRQGEESVDWDTLQVAWTDRLSGFAAAFREGDARVDPTREACRYCSFAASCRINTLSSAGWADE